MGKSEIMDFYDVDDRLIRGSNEHNEMTSSSDDGNKEYCWDYLDSKRII